MRGSRRLIALLVPALLALPAATPSSAVNPAWMRVEPGLLQATGPRTIMARFERSVPDDIRSLAGLDITYRLNAAPAFVADATPGAIRALAAHPDLVYLEADKPIEFDLDSATTASRAREVWGGSAPLTDADGNVIDGRGVGIAIVDTGLDGTHPDFGGDKIRGNYLVVPGGVVPAPYTSPASPHGTHVAGIAAGTGLASDGTYRGVAPGASLYTFSAISRVSFTVTAFDWILTYGAQQDPPIRVVNNSWHCHALSCDNPTNDGQLHVVLASQMAENGITVTWAAGNDRGDGDVATINAEAINPTPGIIGVGDYKDSDWPGLPYGTRQGCLSSSSAWGSSADPTTWPDLVAPGRSVTSTWSAGAYNASDSLGARNLVTGARTYESQTGTSMAAPHVAGLAALLLQANPSLTPAEIEYIVKRTATPLTGDPSWLGCGIDYVRADPAHPWTGANYAAGHGLIDAVAAVDLADGFTGIPDAPPVEALPDGFVIINPGLRIDHSLYLVGESGMQSAYPDAPAPRMRAMAPGAGRFVHTSEPFPEAVDFDALKVDLFLGNSSEHRDLFSVVGLATLFVIVEAVSPDGSVTQIAEITRSREANRTMWPVHRDIVREFPEKQTFAAGDRLRLSVRLAAPGYLGVEPAINGWWNLYTESFTASRVAFATRVTPAAGSREACERVRWCAQIDELHPYQGVMCDDVPFRLDWRGPAGSMLVLGCNGLKIACPVVVLPGETEGTCSMDVTMPMPLTADPGAYCWGVLPDGARGGQGGCRSLVPLID